MQNIVFNSPFLNACDHSGINLEPEQIENKLQNEAVDIIKKCMSEHSEYSKTIKNIAKEVIDDSKIRKETGRGNTELTKLKREELTKIGFGDNEAVELIINLKYLSRINSDKLAFLELSNSDVAAEDSKAESTTSAQRDRANAICQDRRFKISGDILLYSAYSPITDEQLHQLGIVEFERKSDGFDKLIHIPISTIKTDVSVKPTLTATPSFSIVQAPKSETDQVRNLTASSNITSSVQFAKAQAICNEDWRYSIVGKNLQYYDSVGERLKNTSAYQAFIDTTVSALKKLGIGEFTRHPNDTFYIPISKINLDPPVQPTVVTTQPIISQTSLNSSTEVITPNGPAKVVNAHSQVKDISVSYKLPNGQMRNFTIDPNQATVDELRNKVANEDAIPLNTIRLVHAGKQLEDGRKISDYNFPFYNNDMKLSIMIRS